MQTAQTDLPNPMTMGRNSSPSARVVALSKEVKWTL